MQSTETNNFLKNFLVFAVATNKLFQLFDGQQIPVWFYIITANDILMLLLYTCFDLIPIAIAISIPSPSPTPAVILILIPFFYRMVNCNEYCL